MMEATGIPYAHDLAEGESPKSPFLCYLLPYSDNFAADGTVYFKANEGHIKLYTDYKKPSMEQQVEAVLEEHGVFYDKTETCIESEKLYEILYIFEMET